MISEADFIAKLTPIFREELEQPKLNINMDTGQDNLDSWDSLAHVRIVVGVERTFDVELEVSEIETINTVRGLYVAINHHLK